MVCISLSKHFFILQIKTVELLWTKAALWCIFTPFCFEKPLLISCHECTAHERNLNQKWKKIGCIAHFCISVLFKRMEQLMCLNHYSNLHNQKMMCNVSPCSQAKLTSFCDNIWSTLTSPSGWRTVLYNVIISTVQTVGRCMIWIFTEYLHLLAACYPWAGSRELGRTRRWQSPFCWMGRSVQGIDVTGAGSFCHENASEKMQVLTISHVRIWGGFQDDEMTRKRDEWPSFVPSCTLAGGFKAEPAGEWWHLV